MNEEEVKSAVIQISNIIDQWTDMNLDDHDTLEMLEPLLATVITYFDLAPTGDDEKKEKNEDLEKEEKRELDETPGSDEAEQEDLFSKSESEESNDESKSKSKSKSNKSFAGSDGEIPF